MDYKDTGASVWDSLLGHVAKAEALGGIQVLACHSAAYSHFCG